MRRDVAAKPKPRKVKLTWTLTHGTSDPCLSMLAVTDCTDDKISSLRPFESKRFYIGICHHLAWEMPATTHTQRPARAIHPQWLSDAVDRDRSTPCFALSAALSYSCCFPVVPTAVCHNISNKLEVWP